MRTVILVSLLGLVAAPCRAQWAMQASGTTARLRGLSVVDERVAWASGTGGTVLRTTDGGRTWERRPVAGAEALDFRDIEALEERTACALSIGEGEQSRIYRTEDGGASWTLRHVNRDATGFLDALAFWDARHGLALGDPVGGRFAILTTDDGGQTWTRIAPEGLAEAVRSAGIRGVEEAHVAREDQDRILRRRGCLPLSTVASAKGYDAYCVLLASANDFPTDVSGRASFYVGCTRAIEYLEVFAHGRSGLVAEMERALRLGVEPSLSLTKPDTSTTASP